MTSRVKKFEKIEKNEKEKIKKEKKERRKKRGKKMLIILLMLTVLAIIYARFVEPNMLLVHEYKIETEKISKKNHGLKIIHFSDLHYGSTITKNNIEKVIAKINFLKPDIVVFTGDLIEENIELNEDEIKYLTEALKSIETKLGKYAVIGNHDFYNEYVDNVLYDSNFKVLNNEYDLIYNKDNTPIVIYGVENTLYGEPKTDKLNNDLDTYYKILLVHEPDYINNITNNFDLVLAGHSHNGQVKIPGLKPFWLPVGSRTYYEPYYKVNNMDLYVSNGIGSSGINLRFASIPSINLFRITKK